VHFVNIRQ